jgi:UDP-3-O-[3-hydroxymyristoyl] glucosamine N-acyltransferase
MIHSTGIRFTASQLAEMLGAEIRGDAARLVTGVATLHQAGESDLSWVGDKKHAALAEQSPAGIILFPKELPPPAGRTLLLHADPDMAIVTLLRQIGPRAPQAPAGVHPTALVHPSTRLGESAAIGPYVIVEEGAEIGARTQLHAGVFVGPHSRIGEDCVVWMNTVIRERITIGNQVIIHPNCTIGADGYGYLQRGGVHVRIPQIGTVLIENEVEIGAGCTIDRARTGATVVGRGTKIDNLVQIGHNVQIGKGCIIIAQCGLSGSTTLGDYAMLGGQVGLADHVRVGSGAMLAAQSGLMRDVPDGAQVVGTPALPRRQFFRQFSILESLPELARTVRQLENRISQLESAKDDRTGS